MIPLTLQSESGPSIETRSHAIDTGGRRPLVDGHDRVIDHLRLSVTSACNLRCLYCRPGASPVCKPHDLTDTQRLELVRFMADSYGLRQLRLTGGEPLLHPSIVKLIESIRSTLPGLSIAMTTNGWRLGSMAKDLCAAGLDRLNVSLDSIDPATYRELTGGELAPVLAGLEQALNAGFPPPRLNTVVLAGYNDHHLPDLVEWALDRQMEIRFLEAMPIGSAADFNRKHLVPLRRMIELLRAAFQLHGLSRQVGETAVRYTVRRGLVEGTVGLIAPLSESFCGQCRRCRITADGRLFPCLLDDRSVDLRIAWDRVRLDPSKMNALLQKAVGGKRLIGPMHQRTSMVSLGG